MSSNEPNRQWTAEEKLEVIEEARQAGQTVSDVCRRYQISPRLFHLWEKQARQGALEALQNRRPGRKPNDAAATLESEIERLRRVAAELSSENQELRKRHPSSSTAKAAPPEGKRS